MSDLDLWADFLAHEKMTPARVGDDLMTLVELAEVLAKSGPPAWTRSYQHRLEARRRVVVAAIEMGLGPAEGRPAWSARHRAGPAGRLEPGVCPQVRVRGRHGWRAGSGPPGSEDDAGIADEEG